jgi:hypothetical protein
MGEVGVDQRLKLGDELVDALGRQVEPKELDRNELVLAGVVGAKDGAERARSDLMKNAKGTERFGVLGAGSFRVQCSSSDGVRRNRSAPLDVMRADRSTTAAVW